VKARRPTLAACAAAAGLLSAALAGCGGDAGVASPPPAEPVAPAASTGGDPDAGARVWSEAGCGNCHALAAAGSNGSLGPNLDDLAPGFETVVAQVTVGGGGMPSFEGQLTQQEIEDVAAYVATSTGG
jgi:mono/diheme cytochrome c family protein